MFECVNTLRKYLNLFTNSSNFKGLHIHLRKSQRALFIHIIVCKALSINCLFLSFAALLLEQHKSMKPNAACISYQLLIGCF